VITVKTLLMILALVCLALSSIGVTSTQTAPARVHLGWLGLALWALAQLLR
jgi:hypothetical protein